MIQQIHPNYIQQIWPQVVGFLSRPYELGLSSEFTLDQLKLSLVRGEQTLLVVWNNDQAVGALTVAFESYPNDRVAVVTTMGGRCLVNEREFAHFKEWASNNFCTRIRAFVRDEMAELLKRKLGMVKKCTVMEHVL